MRNIEAVEDAPLFTMNISKDVPYGTQCNGRKNFGDSMPGSLNYSPSESEGGRSRIGQADLDKGLVGIDFTVTPGERFSTRTHARY